MNKDNIGHVASNSFLYHLPEDRIAQKPLKNRVNSKLLVYGSEGIKHHRFDDLTDHLPQNSLLFFNNTKVIPARLFFKKETGALIEIFLLNPIGPSSDINLAMEAASGCTWQVLVGNLKKWKIEQTLVLPLTIEGNDVQFSVKMEDRDKKIVRFEWDDSSIRFSSIIEVLGKMPLPPYIHRKATEDDAERYQTVYSNEAGAVAAPTAGLHFNKALLQQIEERGHQLDYLTLHVSAATFKPVTSENVIDHPMHEEQLIVSKSNLQNILAAPRPIIAVGTTSMRTLESIYWLGVKLCKGEPFEFHIKKLSPYQDTRPLPKLKEAVQSLLNYMEKNNLETIAGSTEIMIFPGYKFRVCNGLITNFHMPGSTLIMLVAAFLGPKWRTVYEEALANKYRFLSYGDSSLLLPV